MVLICLGSQTAGGGRHSILCDMSEPEGEGRIKLCGSTNGEQLILFIVLKKVSRIELSFERKVQENRMEEKNSVTSFIACSTCILILNLVELTVSSIFFRSPRCKRDPS